MKDYFKFTSDRFSAFWLRSSVNLYLTLQSWNWHHIPPDMMYGEGYTTTSVVFPLFFQNYYLGANVFKGCYLPFIGFICLFFCAAFWGSSLRPSSIPLICSLTISSLAFTSLLFFDFLQIFCKDYASLLSWKKIKHYQLTAQCSGLALVGFLSSLPDSNFKCICWSQGW